MVEKMNRSLVIPKDVLEEFLNYLAVDLHEILESQYATLLDVEISQSEDFEPVLLVHYSTGEDSVH